MENQINGGDCYRDASFSYLRSEHTSKPNTTTRSSFGLERKNLDHEGEISVFGAERYFNTELHRPHDHDRDRRSTSRAKKQSQNHHDQTIMMINRPGTPSAGSEMSWTSKSTALLLKTTSDVRNPSRNRKWKSFFSTLGCTGTCTDEKSVYVDEEKKPNVVSVSHQLEDHDNHDRHRLRYEAKSTKRPEEHFAFPILSSSAEQNNINPENSDQRLEEEPPRASLEVFGSKTSAKAANVLDDVAINLERKLSVLTWDAIPAKPYNNKVSPKASKHDDIDSDASSDLFEIENITSGGGRSGLPNAGDYEPSEASIEWSVVTASAVADVASEYDEKKLAPNMKPPKSPVVVKRNKAVSGGGGGILGCKSHKAVSVVVVAHQKGD